MAAIAGRRHEGVYRRAPAVGAATVQARIVQHQQAGVKPTIHQTGKTFGLRGQIAPDVGVVIQWIGHLHFVAQHRAQARVCAGRDGRHLQAARLRQIGHQRSFAAGATGRNNALTRKRPVHMQKLAGLDQTCRVAHAGDATAGKQRVIERVRPGQRTGVAHGGLRAQRGGTGFQSDQRHALSQGFQGHAGKRGHIVQTFNMHAYNRHPRV